MNNKVQKTLDVNDYDIHRNILTAKVRVSIESLENNESYISPQKGKIDLTYSSPPSIMIIAESANIPIPSYARDIIIVSIAEQLGWQLGKVAKCVDYPFTIVCNIDDVIFDENELLINMTAIEQMIEATWDAIRGGLRP